MRKTLAYIGPGETQQRLGEWLKQDFKLISFSVPATIASCAGEQTIAGIILSDYTSGQIGGEIRQLRRVFQRATIILTNDLYQENDAQTSLLHAGADYIMRSVKPAPDADKAALLLIGAKLSRGIHRYALRSDTMKPDDTIVRLDGLYMDNERREASYCDTPLNLTVTEFNILFTLAKAPDMIFDRPTLIAAAYTASRDMDSDGLADRTLDTHIKRLRKKMQGLGAPEFINTVYGEGYGFARPVAPYP